MSLTIALPVAILLSAGLGAYFIAPWRIPAILFAGADAEAYQVLAYVRFPRVLLSVIVGAGLACSGACLQGLFRNPLADPGLIGVSSGAAVGAGLWIVFSGPAMGGFGMPIAAFVGALLVTTLAWRVACRIGRISVAALLFAGIALTAIAQAFIGLLTYVASEDELRNLIFWQMGSFGYATWHLVIVTALLSAVGLYLLLKSSRALNAMAFGESTAFSLGVSTEALKRRVLIGTALTVGAGVAAAGGIGFVGLIVPHLLRMAVGADHRWLLPASIVSGAAFMTATDLAARTVAQPVELPVGIITAFTGAPFLLWLLVRERGKAVYA